MTHPLDNPVYASLTGPHAALARRSGYAVRYPAGITPFCGLPAEPSLEDVTSDLEVTSPQINIDIDRDKAAAHGVTASTILPLGCAL